MYNYIFNFFILMVPMVSIASDATKDLNDWNWKTSCSDGYVISTLPNKKILKYCSNFQHELNLGEIKLNLGWSADLYVQNSAGIYVKFNVKEMKDFSFEKQTKMYAIEFSNLLTLTPIPFRLLEINCPATEPCHVQEAQCALEHPISLPAELLQFGLEKSLFDLEESLKDCKNPKILLNKSQEAPPILQRAAILGLSSARKCLQIYDLAKKPFHTQNVSSYPQVLFALSKCPQSEIPTELKPVPMESAARSKLIENLKNTALVAFGKSLSKIKPNQKTNQTATFQNVFRKSGTDWELSLGFIDPNSLYQIEWPTRIPGTVISPLFQLDVGNRISWQLVYDGRDRGVFRTKPLPFQPNGAEIELNNLDLETAEVAAKVEAKQGSFILSNLKKVSDAEKWKLAKPSAAVVELLVAEYQKKFPKIKKCTLIKNKEEPQMEWRLIDQSLKLNRNSIKILDRAFKAENDMWLVGLKNEFEQDNKCKKMFYVNGFEDFEPEYYRTIWYAIVDKRIVEIKTGNFGANPIEAADFDNDGKTEWIFKTNMGVDLYILFWDNFNKKIQNFNDPG